MENSVAYVELIKQIKATGREKMEGYNPKMLDEIYEWEREGAEKIIYQKFCDNDIDVAVYFPKLKNYDGQKLLEDKLKVLNIPSGGSVLIAQVLYETTKDERYLDIIMQNIEHEPNSTSYVATLSYCSPSKKAYDLLVKIYVNNENSTIRSTAVTGILYNKGIINDPCDLRELMKTIDVGKKFSLDSVEERRKAIGLFEEGQL